jgi:O-acetyl-ADP-ribose deacetylase (regulator of RNase III)
MIEEVHGDILLSTAQAVALGISPNDDFDQGLALSLREKWPALAKDYRHYANQVHLKPGELWSWGGVGGARIICLLTQEGSFDHGAKAGRATLANVNHCLRHLRQELLREKITSLALPRLACGVGGLEWEDVRPLILSHLADLQIPIFVYTTYIRDEVALESVSETKMTVLKV